MADIRIPLEDAKKCPECDHTGNVASSNAIMGGTLLVMLCENEVCPWYNTNWMIETNGQGEVQINEEAYKKAHNQKILPPTPEADRQHENAIQYIQRLLREQTQ